MRLFIICAVCIAIAALWFGSCNQASSSVDNPLPIAFAMHISTPGHLSEATWYGPRENPFFPQTGAFTFTTYDLATGKRIGTYRVVLDSLEFVEDLPTPEIPEGSE